MLNLTELKKLPKSLQTKVIVTSYQPKHTETEMTLKEFCDKYRTNLQIAFDNWLAENEEKLPVSVVKDTMEKTLLAELELFLKGFIYNFNTYSYRTCMTDLTDEHEALRVKGLCNVNVPNSNTGKFEPVTIPYVHVLPA